MEFKLNDGCLTIVCGERIDSTNADEFSARCDKIILNNQFSSLVLDFSSTKYISGVRWNEIKVDTYENPFINDIIEVGTGDDI